MHIFLPVFTINRKTFLAPGAHVESKIALRVLNCNPILLVSVDKPNLSRLRFNLPTNSHLEACWTHFCNTFRCFNLRSCNLPRSSVIWKLLSFLDPVTGTRYYYDFRFLDRWIFSQSFYLTWKARKQGIVTNKNCYRYIHIHFFYAKISTWFHFNPPQTEATRDRSRRILVSLVALYSFKSYYLARSSSPLPQSTVNFLEFASSVEILFDILLTTLSSCISNRVEHHLGNINFPI